MLGLSLLFIPLLLGRGPVEYLFRDTLQSIDRVDTLDHLTLLPCKPPDKVAFGIRSSVPDHESCRPKLNMNNDL